MSVASLAGSWLYFSLSSAHTEIEPQKKAFLSFKSITSVIPAFSSDKYRWTEVALLIAFRIECNTRRLALNR